MPDSIPELRDLGHVVTREKAEIGVLISLEEPTGPMRKEAASAGFYTSPWGKHARLQLLTIEDLLTGSGIDRPPAQTSATFKKAPRAKAPRAAAMLRATPAASAIQGAIRLMEPGTAACAGLFMG